MADSLASAIIAPEKLGNFFCKYQFEYYDKQKYDNDIIETNPTDYHITYRLIYKGDTIGSSGISIDSTLHITYCDIADLIGQKYFLERKLTMTKADALATAKLYGVDTQSARAKSETIFYSTASGYDNESGKLNKIVKLSDSLQKSELKFRWDIQNQCDGCITLKIDAETGEVSDKHTIVFMY